MKYETVLKLKPCKTCSKKEKMYFWKIIFTTFYNYSEQNDVNPNPPVQFYGVYQIQNEYEDISPDENFDNSFYDFDPYNDGWIVDNYSYEPKIIYKQNPIHKHHHNKHHKHYRILKEISSCNEDDIKKPKGKDIYYVIDDKKRKNKHNIVRKLQKHHPIPCENPRRFYQTRAFSDSYAQSGYSYAGGFDPYANHYFLNELKNIKLRDKEVMKHFDKTTEKMMNLEDVFVRKAKNAIKANNMARINNKISEKRSELMKEQAKQYVDIKADTSANLRLLGMVPGPVAVLVKKRQLTKKVAGALSKIK